MSPFLVFAHKLSPNVTVFGIHIFAIIFLFKLVNSWGDTKALELPCEYSLMAKKRWRGVRTLTTDSDTTPSVVKPYDISRNPKTQPRLFCELIN